MEQSEWPARRRPESSHDRAARITVPSRYHRDQRTASESFWQTWSRARNVAGTALCPLCSAAGRPLSFVATCNVACSAVSIVQRDPKAAQSGRDPCENTVHHKVSAETRVKDDPVRQFSCLAARGGLGDL